MARKRKDGSHSRCEVVEVEVGSESDRRASALKMAQVLGLFEEFCKAYCDSQPGSLLVGVAMPDATGVHSRVIGMGRDPLTRHLAAVIAKTVVEADKARKEESDGSQEADQG
jgi:hypothetical protein